MKFRLLVYVAMFLFAIGYAFYQHNWDVWSTLKDLGKQPQKIEQPVPKKPVAEQKETMVGEAAPVVQVTNFQKAKNDLKKIFNKPDLRTEFYCGCSYNEHWELDLNGCGYKIRKNADRAKRIEWEHVVPAAFFGRAQSCWRDGGRKGCEKTAAQFNNFEGDLHNLRPSIGEVNGDRSDRMYAEVSIKSPYGKCDFRLGPDGTAEPRDAVKGQAARVWFYMADKHGFEIPEPYRALYVSWAQKFPVTDQERRINDAIKAVQGDSNTYITGEKTPR